MGKNKPLIVFFIILGVIVLGLAGYLLYRNIALQNEVNKLKSATVTATASVSVTKTATKTATKTTTAAAKSDEELIKEALAQKFSTDVSSISMTINNKADSAAFGVVTVGEEPSGGWFVAAKDGGTWKIIASGNGVIDCAVLDQYNVPAAVVPECFDSGTGDSRTR